MDNDYLDGMARHARGVHVECSDFLMCASLVWVKKSFIHETRLSFFYDDSLVLPLQQAIIKEIIRLERGTRALNYIIMIGSRHLCVFRPIFPFDSPSFVIVRVLIL